MTLTTHIIIAAAVIKPLVGANPVFVFLAALASHYLSDAIPHWDYRLPGVEADEDETKLSFSWDVFLREGLVRTALDGTLGAGILLLIWWPTSSEEMLRTVLVIIGGALPDALQGLYYGLKYFGKDRIMEPLQRFHDAMHSKIKLGPYPRVGIPFQILVFLIALYFLW